MGRAPCCEEVGLKKGRWTREEDEILTKYIQAHGEGSWKSLPKNAGLLRCGKSCRLRWINYLRADLKRGNITPEEQHLIVQLHSTLGKRWSLIAGHLPGRTDNEIKNYWNSYLSRRIYSFTKTVATTGNDQPPPTAMNAATAVGGSSKTTAVVNATLKKRKGRTSRSCMKKKTLMSSSPESSNKSAGSKKDVDDTNQDHLMTTAGALALAPAAEVPFIKELFKGTRMHGSYVDNTGWNIMGGGGGGETDNTAMLAGLGPYEWLDSEIMRLHEFLMQGESVDLDLGLDGLQEMEREGDVQGLNQGMATETEMEKAAVVTVSYGESNGEWYNCSGNHNNSSNNNNNSSSSSVKDWFDWDWTSGAEFRNQRDEDEKMLAWLGGSSCSWTDEEASDNNSSLPKDTQEGIV